VSKKLYVGNLAYSATEDSVRQLFSQYGEVVSVAIITDKYTGRSRGFCFVEMENADEAVSQLNGKEFEGRALTVNEARERPARPRRDDGGYGGGRQNRGGYGRGQRHDRDSW